MDNKVFNIKIPELIVKSISSSCAVEEITELEKWLSDENNQKIYDNIIKKIKKEEHYSQYKSIHTKAAWKKLDSKIVTKKVFCLKRFLKYAAIIAFPVLLATFLILQLYNSLPNEIKEFSKLHLPGSSKAKLITESGKIFELENLKNKHISDKIVEIKNTGEALIYSKANQKIEKLQLKEQYHTIYIPTGGEYYLELSDGTKIWLNSETKIKYPKYLVDNKRVIELEGEAYFEVAHNPNKPFVVNTKKGIVKVLGTKFNIMAYNDEKLNVTTLIEGSINLCHKFDKESAINLKPGNQAKIISVNHKIRVDKVNTADVIAWKDKRFVFNKEPLESIFHKLSRWYGFEFKFSDKKVKSIRISADIKRFDELSLILQFIENVAESPITFEIKNNILYVGSRMK
jgi:hypothetical protein